MIIFDWWSNAFSRFSLLKKCVCLSPNWYSDIPNMIYVDVGNRKGEREEEDEVLEVRSYSDLVAKRR